MLLECGKSDEFSQISKPHLIKRIFLCGNLWLCGWLVVIGLGGLCCVVAAYVRGRQASSKFSNRDNFLNKVFKPRLLLAQFV